MLSRPLQVFVALAVAAVVVLPAWGAAASAHGWTIQTAPNPSGSAFTFLRGISCSSTSSCMAVGEYEQSASFTDLTLAEHWDGTAWTIQSTPNASGAPDSALGGVSCPAATTCVAVGWSQGWVNQPYFSAPLAEIWNGSNWTVQSPPVPSGATDSSLVGISCTSATDCTAVGSYTDTAGDEAFAEHWDGATWTLQSAVSPPVGSYLTSVSCAAVGSCDAVGGTGDTVAGGSVTFAEGWNGVSWSPQAAPDPPGATNSALEGVSCASATDCTAVGGSAPGSGTLAERWNGVNWSIEDTPALPNAGTLNGVSCTTGGICIAVGTDSGALAERWDGTSWTQQDVPAPSGAALESVSCPKQNVCAAVGAYGNPYQPLIESYS